MSLGTEQPVVNLAHILLSPGELVSNRIDPVVARYQTPSAKQELYRLGLSRPSRQFTHNPSRHQAHSMVKGAQTARSLRACGQ